MVLQTKNMLVPGSCLHGSITSVFAEAQHSHHSIPIAVVSRDAGLRLLPTRIARHPRHLAHPSWRRFQDTGLYLAWKQGLQLLLAMLFSPTGLAHSSLLQPGGSKSQRDIAKGYRALAATVTAEFHRSSAPCLRYGDCVPGSPAADCCGVLSGPIQQHEVGHSSVCSPAVSLTALRVCIWTVLQGSPFMCQVLILQMEAYVSCQPFNMHSGKDANGCRPS